MSWVHVPAAKLVDLVVPEHEAVDPSNKRRLVGDASLSRVTGRRWSPEMEALLVNGREAHRISGRRRILTCWSRRSAGS
jgi:hypothetical protein